MRLLTIDVGNTSVHFGLFEGNKLIREWRVETRSSKLEIRNKLEILNSKYETPKMRVVISSVVPKFNKILKKIFPGALFVDHKNIGIKIKVKKPAEVGADRLVNALAVYELYDGPAIIVDFGTATTFDVINGRGEYLGGAIAPGLLLSRDVLAERTAKLPLIKLRAPKRVIGKSTLEAMASGLVLGYTALVEGMIGRMRKELRRKIKIIATGGLAPLICQQTEVIDIMDENLTLKGLQVLSSKL